MPEIGLIVPPDQPPERMIAVARAAERADLTEVWLWEDCFAQSGVAPAAALLAATDRLRVGLGLMPVPLRSVALTAMEIATLHRIFPGRFLPGIGHGVLDWMGQVGARVESPLTLLREYATALRALLDGAEVTVTGRYVRLDQVRLRWPPLRPEPLLIGAVGRKTLALAGGLGDGVIFSGTDDPDRLAEGLAVARAARAEAPHSTPATPFEAVAFCAVPGDDSPESIAHRIGQYAAAGATRVAVLALGPEGPPEGSERLRDFVGRLAEAARLTG